MSEPALTLDLVRRMEIKPTLDSCERTIGQALHAYAVAGDALRMIRDGRLYKPAHQSFEEYCRERWGWQRNYADKQIAAAAIYNTLFDRAEASTTVLTFQPPRSERVARELAPLAKKPKQLEAAWSEVVERHGPDAEAKHVRKVVRELVPSTNGSTPAVPPERTLDDAVTLLRRQMDNGYAPSLLRQALDAIDPNGRHQ